MRWLLDTNIVSDLASQGLARRKSAPASSSRRNYVMGPTKKGSPRLARQLEAVLGALDVVPFAAPADTVYGEIRTRLEQTGKPIGGNDLLIAAQTMALGYTGVTDTRRSSPGSTCFFARIGCGQHDQP